jgi:ceramide glucosyltransferase
LLALARNQKAANAGPLAAAAIFQVSHTADIRSPMNLAFLLGGVFVSVALAAQLASTLTVFLRVRRRDYCTGSNAPPVSIVRPVCGVENFIEETLRSTFLLDYRRYEIVFCAAEKNDPVIPVVQKLIAAYPDIEAKLLIGAATVSSNPKLNNLIKGWYGSRHEWTIMADSNVLMPRDYIQRMLSAWRDDTGLVCSPPVGSRPQNLWAELECAFLNTYQARWQCFADSVGLAFAQGKSMLWRRDLLESAGGIEALARDIAEDAAATKIVHRLGLRVRLVSSPFPQPLGHRTASEVWDRQLRWARLRRKTFPFFFFPELLVGAFPPLIIASIAAAAAGWSVIDIAATLMLVWYGVEACLAYRAGWHFSWRSVGICILRDALLPVLWLCAWAGNDFEWRGNAMTIATESARTS